MSRSDQRAIAGIGSEFNRRVLWNSFSLLDPVWFLLALAAAFKLGSAGGAGVEDHTLAHETHDELPAQIRAVERKESSDDAAGQRLAPARGAADDDEDLVADSLTGVLGVAGKGDSRTIRRR